MNFDIGKVIELKNHRGRIFSKSGIYDFLDKDVVEGEVISLNDFVIFRKDVIEDINHASFIRYFSKNLTSSKQSDLERLLKRND